MSKIYDISRDSIELRARPLGDLKRVLKDNDARLEGLPDGFIEMKVLVGGEQLVLWFPPEAAQQIEAALDDKRRQCRAHEYDPS